MNIEQTKTADLPMWRKIWEFPITVLFVAIPTFIVVWVGAEFALSKWHPEFTGETLVNLRLLLVVAACLLIYKIFIAKLGRFKKDDLPTKNSLLDVAVGLGVGAALMTTVVGIAAVAGAYRVIGIGGMSDILEIIVVTGIGAAVIEEILLRGIIFRWVEELAGSFFALLISSLLFGFGHALNPNATLFSSIVITLSAGILLGGAYMLTRSLWLAIGIHAGWNVTQGLVWGIPVSGFEFDGILYGQLFGPNWLSGGAFGLEASVITLAVAGPAGVWIVWQAQKAGQWMPIGWRRA